MCDAGDFQGLVQRALQWNHVIRSDGQRHFVFRHALNPVAFRQRRRHDGFIPHVDRLQDNGVLSQQDRFGGRPRLVGRRGCHERRAGQATVVLRLERAKFPECNAGHQVDLVSGVERMHAGQLAGIESVEVVDELTANVVTAAPFPALPVLLARVPMVPPVYAEEAGLGGFASEPVGTGPFQFVEWVKDDRIVLEANPDYWKAPPKLQRVVFKPIPEDSARVAALKGKDTVAKLITRALQMRK